MATGNLGGEAGSESWRPQGKPILNALLDHVPDTAERPPWRPGTEMSLQGLGGLVDNDRRHYTIIGHGNYANHVGGRRTLKANSQTIRTTGEFRTSIGGDTGLARGAGWGHDSLTVEGDAEIKFGSRLVMMSGIVNRRWNGGVMRLASMEGVICGGGFLRLIAGPSATLSGANSGDVYGGCSRVSVVRSYLAVLQYRAAQTATWTMGIYNRTATFVVEPVVGTPSGNPATNTASKLARLGRTFEMARMLCPVLDILVGVATLIPFGVYALYRLISGALGKQIAAPPAGPPRIRNQNVVARTMAYQSMVTT